MSDTIFWPMVAQFTLSAIVGAVMYRRRVGEMRREKLAPQALATRMLAGGKLSDTTAADNFQNLFEVPTLFFAVCLAIAVTGTATVTHLCLAWSYFGLRAAHSVIHLTYNRVVHRFVAFMASNIVLVVMWLLFAYHLAR